MDSSQNKQSDGNSMTKLAEPGTSSDGHVLDIHDGQMSTTVAFVNVGRSEVVEESSLTAGVDPLALPTSEFLSADEMVTSPSYGTPGRTTRYTLATPRRVFKSMEESSPSVSTPVRNMFATVGVDAATGVFIGGRRVAGRKQAVVEDDTDYLSSSSAASAGRDSSSHSSQVKGKGGKGVKRGREKSKDKDCRKEKKTEGNSEEDKRKKKGGKKEIGRKENPKEVDSGDEVYGVPRGAVEQALEDMSLSGLGGAILEWASKIEEIRGKSTNLQGRLSGELKKYVAKIKQGTVLLMSRTLGMGDSKLRMRNSELTDQLSEAVNENVRLREQLRKEKEKEKDSPVIPSPPRKKKTLKAVTSNSTQVDSGDFPPLPQRIPCGGKLQDVERKKVGPRIISDVQVAPPIMEPLNKEVSTPVVLDSEAEWSVATGSRRKGRSGGGGRGDEFHPPSPPSPPVPVGSRPPVRQQQQQPKVRFPRPPVSSAVTITGRTEGFSYAEAMRGARKQIDLESLGIKTSRVRKALNGGLLIEISGEDSRLKAEELVTRLRSVLKESAVVTCPVKKRELNVVGFDESVTTDEIVQMLSNVGGCPREDIKIGPIRTLSSGLGMVWVQLPVAAAVKVAEERRIRVGWTMARVDLLKIRPLQCYKCWAYGHVQSRCRSVVDRFGVCFRCGQKGHLAGICQNPVHCAVCHDAGLVASHRLGGPQCMAQDREDNRIDRTDRTD